MIVTEKVAMPLRDHFRAPLDDIHSGDELHGKWPAMVVRQLAAGQWPKRARRPRR